MDCPISTAPNGPREGELTPYACPIVYCPPITRSSSDGIEGNFTFSMCVKHVDHINPDNKQFVKKTCETSYSICSSSSCNAFKENIRFGGSEISYNHTKYISAGCKQGDQTISQNKSSIFPISSQFSVEVRANPPMRSSTSQNQATLLMPCLFMLLLAINFIQRKI